MREILFRGKRFDNGEWIEGNYRAVRNSHFLYIERIDKPTDCYRIDPETVGQYTGLTDKNGKKIFEGDICLGAWKTRFEVYWDKELSWRVKNTMYHMAGIKIIMQAILMVK